MLGDFIVIALFDLMDHEQALGGFGVFGDDAVVRLGVGDSTRGGAEAATPTATARRSLRRRLVLGM